LVAALQGRADAQEFIAGFAGGHHHILEYLTEEVLARQTEPVRQFLLQICILDRFCGPLCDRVMGWEPPVQPEGAQTATTQIPGVPSARLASQETLQQPDHANLFIVPLDDQRLWYRYHRLFAGRRSWVQLWLFKARPMAAMASDVRGMSVAYHKEGTDPGECHAHYGQRLHQRRREWLAPRLLSEM
jgi:hypothetical protein